MKEKLTKKLEHLKEKKEEYIDQVKCLNGAIQCLEEILKEEENDNKYTINIQDV